MVICLMLFQQHYHIIYTFILQVLNKTGEFTADIVEASLSSISKIVNKTFAFSNENIVAHNDIIQSVDIMLTISKKVVNFTNQDAANKTTQVWLLWHFWFCFSINTINVQWKRNLFSKNMKKTLRLSLELWATYSTGEKTDWNQKTLQGRKR